MTSKTLKRHDDQENKKILRSTRSTTRKSIADNRTSLEKVKIFFYELNGKNHEVKVELDDEEISKFLFAYFDHKIFI